MKDAELHIDAMPSHIWEKDCVLMLDFDGTLTPIVTHPKNAVMLSKTRETIRRAAKKFPVAIISGRPLEDIKRLVGIPGITYAGEHGRTWQIGARRFQKPVPAALMRALKAARKELILVARKYPTLVREEK